MIKNLKLAALSLDGSPIKEQSSNINQLIPNMKNFLWVIELEPFS